MSIKYEDEESDKRINHLETWEFDDKFLTVCVYTSQPGSGNDKTFLQDSEAYASESWRKKEKKFRMFEFWIT